MAMEIVGLDMLGASRPVSGKLAQARAKVAASRKRAQAASAAAGRAAAAAVASASRAVRVARAAPARSEAQRLLAVAQEAQAHAAQGARKASATKPTAVRGVGPGPMAIDPGTAGLTAEFADAIATSAALDGVTDEMSSLLEAIKALQEQIQQLSTAGADTTSPPPSDTTSPPPADEQQAAADDAQAQAEDQGMDDLFASHESSDEGADLMGVDYLDIASKAVASLTQARPLTPEQQMQMEMMAEDRRRREADEDRTRLIMYGALGLGALGVVYLLTRGK